MNMSAGRGSGHGASKGNERDAGLAEIGQKRSPFVAVRMKRHVDGISMIESKAIMSRGLTEGADRQSVTKRSRKKFFNFPSISQRPRCSTVKPYERAALAI